ncbi:hypothetical protein DRO97_07080, partial [Archaeoglobales archaeon]
MEEIQIGKHYEILRKVMGSEKLELLPEFKLDEDVRVLENYWVAEPFSKVVIVEDSNTYKLKYNVVEP